MVVGGKNAELLFLISLKYALLHTMASPTGAYLRHTIDHSSMHEFVATPFAQYRIPVISAQVKLEALRLRTGTYNHQIL